MEKTARPLLFAAGLLIIAAGLNTPGLADDDAEYIGSTSSYASYGGTESDPESNNFHRLLEGTFGSLIMVVAGLGALVSSAMGNYKAGAVMLAVAVGMFGFKGMLNVVSGYDDVKH